MKIVVNKRRCPENHPCPSVRICPVGAIIQEGFKAPTIDYDKCLNCKRCLSYCPMGAFSIEQ